MKNLLLGLTLALASADALAQSTRIIYQGRLDEHGNPGNGSYDLTFALFDAASAGTQQGNSLSNMATLVTNGLFNVTLDFGNQFPGADRWLEISVRTNGGGSFTALSPRQQLTSTPYAVQAANAASAASVAAGNITGTLPLAQLPAAVVTNGSSSVNISGTFSGNGGGVTNLNLSANSEGLINLSGGFMVSASPAAGSSPYAVKATDVNGDGKVDLICANNTSFSGTLTVLTNNGKGKFAISSANAVRPNPVAVEVADLNGDGKADLISGSFNDGSLTILTNNGAGGFGWSSVIIDGHPSANSVVAADMSGDGKLDLISPNNTGSVLLYINNGSGGFVLTTVPGAGGSPRATEVADVNLDGRLDLICVNFLAAGTLTVLTNNGSGGFAVSSTPSVGSFPYAVKAADINGDGAPDLICPNYSDNSVSVLTNKGSGSFAPLSTIDVGANPTSVEAADIDNDGRLDLICANLGTNRLTILLNRGPNAFLPTPSPNLSSGSYSVVAADVNGDGKIDLIHANTFQSSVSVLQNVPLIYGAFSGSGSALSALDAGQLTFGIVPDTQLGENVARTNQVWLLGGNAGTTAGANYLGTSDAQPLELKVGGSRGWRLEPTVSDGSHFGIVNVVGGSPANGIGAGIYGATIAGGGAVNYLGVSGTNRVDAHFGTVGGGWSNAIQRSATYSTIGGGWLNTIQSNAIHSTLSGGTRNTIQTNAFYSTISGGEEHVIQTNAYYSTIGGGQLNTNLPNANYATIPGGVQNSATNYAFAAGRRAKAIHTGSFVWADSTPADFASTANNQFSVRAGGGARFQSSYLEVSGGGGEQAYLGGDGAGGDIEIGSRNAGIMNVGFWNSAAFSHMNVFALSFTPTSDRNAKEHFKPVDVQAVLDKVASLPLTEWNYKADAATKHVGPMAQDFYAAFDVGPDDKHIATVDADGIALAAIQGLNQKLEAARAENADLRQRLERLESLLDKRTNAMR